MSVVIRTIRLATLAMLAALGLLVGVTAAPALAAPPWSAPISLSTPIPPTDVVGNPSVAVNAAGAQLAAWYDQAADGTQFVHVRSSADGTSWSAPTTLGHGVEPTVALAPDGRAVAVWVGLDGAGSLQASVRPPGGSWSSPATIASGQASRPLVQVDQSGDALVAWSSSAGGLQRATLPAGGSWSAPQQLAAGLSDFDLAVNTSGAAVAAWTAPGGAIVAESGSVLGSWGAPVTIAAASYRQNGVHAALNDAGQAALAWRTRAGALATTRTPDGTWSAPSVLTTSQASGSVDVAVDGAGNAAAVLIRYVAGSTTQFPVYVSRRPVGGSWGTPVLLSTLNEYVGAPQVVADANGTFVAAWNDDNSSALKASTSPPGGSFGTAVTVGAGTFGEFSLSLAPGHAVALWTSGGATVSTEPVS